jgi:hypothetical protein
MAYSLRKPDHKNKKNKKHHKGHKKSHKHKGHMSFLETHDEEEDGNAIFYDDLALEDKFDPSALKKNRPLMDYNNGNKYGSDELVEKIKDDLRGEDVEYNFDS